MVLSVTFANFSMGQSAEKYFDKYFQRVSEFETEYRRAYETTDLQKVVVQDYKSDSLILYAEVYALQDILKVDNFVLYVRNSLFELNKKPYFNTVKGHFTTYESDGTTKKFIYDADRLKYYQISDKTTANYLNKGTGRHESLSSSKDEKSTTIYIDSLIVDAFVIRSVRKDTIYGMYDRGAEPTGGFNAFFNDIISTLKYPYLKRLAGQESQIHIQFTVDKNGRLTDFVALTPKTTQFEKKTINKLSKFKNWNPAFKDGKPVKTRFILPVTFKLE